MMKLVKKTGKSRSGGFTLVELIVVLVILGILAAIMVPALLGWIDKARNQDAILECRVVVQAAQGQVAEIFGRQGADNDKVSEELNKAGTLEAITDLAGVDGTVYNKIKLKNYVVSYLEYKTKKEIEVIYDITANPVYRIVTEATGSRSTNGKEHYDHLVDKMTNDAFINDAGIITKELVSKVVNSGANRNEKNENVSRVLQDYFKNNVGDGEYPMVSNAEIEFIKNAVGKYDNQADPLKGASWRPIVAAGGEVILVAAKGNGYGNANGASVIYYNGNYYGWTHSHDGRLTTCTVGDGAAAKFDVSSLTDEGTKWKLLE